MSVLTSSLDSFVLTRTAHFTVGWFDFASMALLVYDYILTLDDEMRLVWGTRWNIGKALFLLTRYLPFLDTAMVLLIATYTPKTLSICTPLYSFTGWMQVIGITVAEVILILRTWVIWDRNRGVLGFLVALLTGVVVCEGVFVQKFLNSIQYSPLSEEPNCTISSANKILFGSFALVMLFETAVLILTGIRAVKHFRRSSSGIITIIYRDGFLFYLYLFALSVANVIVLVVVPHQFANILTTLQRVFHSVLSARLLLNLREASSVRVVGVGVGSTTAGDHTISLNSMKFGNPVMALRPRTHFDLDTLVEINVPNDHIKEWFGEEKAS